MDTLVEAFKELKEKTITEHWDRDNLDRHYAWDPRMDKNITIGDNGEEKSAHGHVAPTISILQQAFEMGYRYPLYFGLSEEQYAREAEMLAKEFTSNATDESTRTGIESFLGTNQAAYPDCVYKIRFKSKLLNKEAISEIPGIPKGVASVIWNMYVQQFGTSEFCDIVVYVNNNKAKFDPIIKTFYPCTREAAERIIDRCKVFSEEDSVIDENDLSAKLIIVDSLSKGYSYNNPPSYGSLKCLIASPTKVSTPSKSREKGIDNYVAYKQGVLYDPETDKLYPFDVEELQHWKDNTVLSSKTPGIARQAFRKAALKTYADIRNKTFRSDSTDRVPYFWASDFNDAKNTIENGSAIRDKLNSWGLDDTENYRLYDSNIQSMVSSLLRNWDKK